MASATLNLNVQPRRMLRPAEAAGYCGLSGAKFKRECPVSPIRFDCGDERYDMRDLDKWLDTFKAGPSEVEKIIDGL